MPRYEYCGFDCPMAQELNKNAICDHVIQLSAVKCQDFGKTRACPIKGCVGKVTRVMSTGVGFIIKGKAEVPWKPGEAAYANVNGQEIKFQFIDHPHDNPLEKSRLHQMAKNTGVTQPRNAISSSHWSEKHDRPVVEVVSNVPDPLGKIQKSMVESGQKVDVNQPYKVRKPSRDPNRPRGILPRRRGK